MTNGSGDPAADVGGLDGRFPIVLLPVRLETRFAGAELRVRVYPDDIHADTHEVKDPNDTGKWYEFCAKLRDAAAEINAAAHAKDQAKAKDALTRLNQSCDRCHEVFRKELAAQ